MNGILDFLTRMEKKGRPWTSEETKEYKNMNDELLKELNKTLLGIDKGKLNMAVFCPGQVGDLITTMSVLKYSESLWTNHNVIFFTNFPNADILFFSPIAEVRPYPWANNGLPPNTPDFYPLLCQPNNRLNKELASEYELTKDLHDGYFPTPWMLSPEKRHGIDYPNVSRTVFGVPMDWEWHPLLSFSEQEKRNAENFIQKINWETMTEQEKEKTKTIIKEYPVKMYRKTIMLETFCGSSQSLWDDAMTIETMKICRSKWGACNFLFASHKNHSQFSNEEGYFSCADLSVRQTALLIEYCDLFIGIGSGISMATSYWGSKPVPKLQYCGSQICSAGVLATGEITLIASDGRPKEQSQKEFYEKLKSMTC